MGISEGFTQDSPRGSPSGSHTGSLSFPPGSEIRLVPRGAGRFVGAAFLSMTSKLLEQRLAGCGWLGAWATNLLHDLKNRRLRNG
jgi:hypothetical protein